MLRLLSDMSLRTQVVNMPPSARHESAHLSCQRRSDLSAETAEGAHW